MAIPIKMPDGTMGVGVTPSRVPEPYVPKETPKIDNKMAISALLASEGKISKALETLGTSFGLDPRQKLDRNEFIRALCDSPNMTNSALRTASTVMMFDLVSTLTETIRNDVTNLETEDALKATDAFMRHVESLTRPQTGPTGNMSGQGMVQMIFNNLPREAGNAVQALAEMTPERVHALRRQLMAEQGKLGITEGEFTVEDGD